MDCCSKMASWRSSPTRRAPVASVTPRWLVTSERSPCTLGRARRAIPRRTLERSDGRWPLTGCRTSGRPSSRRRSPATSPDTARSAGRPPRCSHRSRGATTSRAGSRSGRIEPDTLEFESGPDDEIVLQWATYADASDEAGISRLYGGIHISADDVRGREIGFECGRNAWALAQQYYEGSVTPS